MAYGKLKVDTLVYDNNGTDQEFLVNSIDPAAYLRLDANGNLSIGGTASPGDKLHVIGNQKFEGDMGIFPQNAGGEGGQLTLSNPDKTTTGATIDISSANAFRIFQLNDNSVMELGQLGGTGGIVKFATAGSERVRIDSSGRVGINTTTFADSATGLVVKNGSSSNEHTFLDMVCDTNESNRLRFSADGSNFPGEIRYNTLGNDLLFTVNSSERLRINNSGNVGIGTTAISERLTVLGPTTSASNLTNPVMFGNSGTHTNSGHKQGEGVAIGFQLRRGNDGATANTAYIKAEAEADLGSSWPTALTFGTQRFGADPIEHLRLASTGNLGIGTTSPRGNLHLHSSSATRFDLTNTATGTNSGDGSTISIDSTSGALNIIQREAQPIIFNTNNTQVARIDSSGRLLVQSSSAPTQGVYSQFAPLTVQGYIGSTTGNGILNVARGTTASNLSSGSDIGTVVFSDSTGGEFGRISCFADAAPGANDYPGRIGFFTTSDASSSPTERMRIDSSGNVGIGASNPAARAHLRADGNEIKDLLFLQNRNGGANAGCQIAFGNGLNDLNENRHAYIRALNTGASHNGNHLTFGTNPTGSQPVERMRITSTGNVGIGTSAVDGQLEVRSDSSLGVISRSTSTQSTNSNKAYRARNNSGSDTFTVSYRGQGYFGAGLDVQGDNVTFGPANTTQQYQGLTLKNGKDSSAATTTSYIDFRNNLGTVDGHIFCDHNTDGSSNLIFGNTSAGARDSDRRAERMRISGNGQINLNTGGGIINVGSGTTDGVTFYPPADPGSGAIQTSTNGGPAMYLRRRTSNGTIIDLRRDTASVGTISVTTTATAYNTSSDYRLKENVVDIADGITRVKQLAPKRFNFIADADTTVDGFLAHEAQTVVPEAVTGEKDGEEMQGIDQSKLVPLLTAALQEAIAKIETLEQRLTDGGL